MPLLMGALLALGGLLLYPLSGIAAWDPLFAYISDSYLSLGLTWVGLAVISVLLFVAALLEVKENRESSSPGLGFAFRPLWRFSRSVVRGMSLAASLNFLFSDHCLSKAIMSVRSFLTELTVLIVAVGLTSIARRLQ